MLESIYIDNFRSIKDTTLNLGKVNLFIGPNNSGKSNFLKAIEFFGESIQRNIEPDELFGNFFKKHGYELGRNIWVSKNIKPIKIALKEIVNEEADYCGVNFFGFDSFNKNPMTSVLLANGKVVKYDSHLSEMATDLEELNLNSFLFEFTFFALWDNFHNAKDFVPFMEEGVNPSPNYALAYKFDPQSGEVKAQDINLPVYRIFDGTLWDKYKSARIYKPEPLKMMMPFSMKAIKNTETIDADIFNIIPFLDTMQRKHHKVFKHIEEDLKRFTPEFESIAFDIVEYNQESYKVLGLKAKDDQIYWAEELSEGVLYFLGLLAIIHQPQPPAILLLEEPEKGIHPRRIQEVMRLIFELAYEKDIQVIITTHSTIVVDQFEDIPESVFVFEMHDEVTSVKNLKTDIIDPSNKKLKSKKLPPIEYTNGLGEHWAMGFLGGVPS